MLGYPWLRKWVIKLNIVLGHNGGFHAHGIGSLWYFSHGIACNGAYKKDWHTPL